MVVQQPSGATSAPPDHLEVPESATSRRRKSAERHPSRPAGAALIAACRRDYLAGQAEDARRPTDPYRRTPLYWEGNVWAGRGAA
ncbi:hypothetical protein ABTZ03_31510 [Kitasatospora sp. NPDC096077]|uniref:hypothetical protein n=1 Tax=Kitasatospora sp. NPDC096077 TaxID=3155544 RepID=UPI00332E77F3